MRRPGPPRGSLGHDTMQMADRIADCIYARLGAPSGLFKQVNLGSTKSTEKTHGGLERQNTVPEDCLIFHSRLLFLFLCKGLKTWTLPSDSSCPVSLCRRMRS